MLNTSKMPKMILLPNTVASARIVAASTCVMGRKVIRKFDADIKEAISGHQSLPLPLRRQDRTEDAGKRKTVTGVGERDQRRLKIVRIVCAREAIIGIDADS